MARRGKKRPHTKALSVVRTLSGQAVCADPDRTAEHAESVRLPPPPPLLSSSASQSSSSSSSVPVGLAAAIGGRKKKQFGPSLDGRCSRGREGRKQLGGVATAAVTQTLFHFPLHGRRQTDEARCTGNANLGLKW